MGASTKRTYHDCLGGILLYKEEIVPKTINYFNGRIASSLLTNLYIRLLSISNPSSMEGYINNSTLPLLTHLWTVDAVLEALDSLKLHTEQISTLVGASLKDAANSNVLDSMIRYIVINYRDKLVYHLDVDGLNIAGTTIATIKLGNLPLCSCNLELSENSIHNNSSFIHFDDIYTRPSLRSLKLGEELLKCIFQDMINHFPNRVLISYNVMPNNIRAHNFYTRLGGVLFDYHTPSLSLDENALKNYHMPIGVHFSLEVIKEYASELDKKPLNELSDGVSMK